MIGTEGARLLWEMWDSWDPTDANASRRLSARPMESEHPGEEINAFSIK